MAHQEAGSTARAHSHWTGAVRRAALAGLAVPLVLVVGVTGVVPAAGSVVPGSIPDTTTRSADQAVTSKAPERPRLRVRTVVRGLANPWDVAQVGRRTYLVTERDSARLSVVRDGRRRTVRFPSSKVWVSGETGLMSLAPAPRWKKRRLLHVCSGWETADGHDIRVTTWRLNRRLTRATKVRTLVKGIPNDHGRHGGCRVLVDPSTRDVYVGTGDSADADTPQDLTSLAGKVLRVAERGGPASGNPFAGARNTRQRLLWTYGHRNVQGLAQRRPGGTVWSVEQGTDRDDEVNRLAPGANHGWQPGPDYDESAPMTDQSLPGVQVEAVWSSGRPTLATSGAAFVRGKRWGAWRGRLAVAALKASRVLFLDTRSGAVATPRALRRYGRLRSVAVARNGDLLLTTDNGVDDRVLRVSPR